MAVIDEIVERYAGRPAMALVALQEIQASEGYLSDEAFRALSKATRVAEGDLRGIASFYTELSVFPRGRHRISVCGGDSCAAVGSQNIARAVAGRLGLNAGGTTGDGRFTCDTVYCLGNCALSPAISVDGEILGRCTSEGAVRYVEALQDD